MPPRFINDPEREQWVRADETLHLMHLNSGLGIKDFVYSRRSQIDRHIIDNIKPTMGVTAQGWQTPPPSMLTVPLPKPKRGRPRKNK
jgi:hypothetical protein